MATLRIPVEETFAWQRTVLALVTTLPGSPSKGDRYIYNNSIAWYSGSVWMYDIPSKGWVVYNKENAAFYIHSGSVWILLTSNLDITESIDDVDIRIYEVLDALMLHLNAELASEMISGTAFRIKDGALGASGSFTTVDLKTVTVTNGIITSIV